MQVLYDKIHVYLYYYFSFLYLMEYTYNKEKQYRYLICTALVFLFFTIIHISVALHRGKYRDACLSFFSDSYIHIKDDWITKITQFRGKNTVSILGVDNEKSPELINKFSICLNNALLNSWHLIHMFNQFLYGLFVPYLFYFISIFGIAFELFEYFFTQCHDIIDIVYNTIGLSIGVVIHFMIFNTSIESIFGVSSMSVAIIFAAIIAIIFHSFMFYKIYSYHKSNHIENMETETKANNYVENKVDNDTNSNFDNDSINE